jgi:hypothetical protein
MIRRTMPGQYILVGQTPVPEPDLLTWARWFEENDRRVAKTVVFDIALVSTVFLGLDYHFGSLCGYDTGPPLVFESMIFWEDEGGEEMDRCSTWTEAEAMHRQMVEEASSPRAVWSYCRRRLRDGLEKMRRDLSERLREL